MYNSDVVLQPEQSFKRENIMFGKIKKLFFVGIGGAGMSGIAEILFNLGYEIKGSDSTPSEITEYLDKLGIKIFTEHKAANLKDVDVVVITSAVGEENPEVVEAAVYGIEDPEWGQIVAAKVVAPGVDDQDLDWFLRSRLAGFKIPTRWTFVASIPRTSLGKIDRSRVKLPE